MWTKKKSRVILPRQGKLYIERLVEGFSGKMCDYFQFPVEKKSFSRFGYCAQ